jgi:hypothetical protein
MRPPRLRGDFRTAIEMDGTVRQRLGSILKDREFVRQVLQ